MLKAVSAILFSAAAAVALSPCLHAQSQPLQPKTGPGGSTYTNTSVTTKGPFYPSSKQGNDSFRYFIYQPASPIPASAPVVLFLHGSGAYAPETYSRWIFHIVKNGYSVIWVQYGALFSTPSAYYENARAAYADALVRMQSDSTFVQPQREQYGTMLTGIVGHSLGAYIAMVLAGWSTQTGSQIPVPLAYFSSGSGFAIAQTNYQSIPASTKVVFLVGSDDTTVCKASTELLWNLLPQIPLSNKKFLAMRSDRHGNPDIIADHFFPITVPAPGPAIDIRDFGGTWKLSVATLNCAIRDTNCEYAVADGTTQQLDMGKWSDGVPVNTLQWAATPAGLTLPCETASTTNR